MNRTRDVKPAEHTSEQLDHACQFPRTQSTGQVSRSQLALPTNSGQAAPPAAVGLLTIRERDFELVEPQVALQLPHAAQFDTLQSAGQVDWVHAVDSLRSAGHAAPAPIRFVVIECVRADNPEPHVTEQLPQADQADIRQSTGHTSALQIRSVSVTGQEVPVCACMRTWSCACSSIMLGNLFHSVLL